MELIMVGIGIPLFMLFWQFIWKPTMLDMHRDALFDLRHQIRDDFIANFWALDSIAYKRLRDLLNGYLRYTEKFALSEFTHIEKKIKGNNELQKAMKARFEQQFNDATREQHEYMMKLRSSAREIMMSYMILSSAPLAFLTLILSPFISAFLVLDYFRRGITSGSLAFLGRLAKARDLSQVFSSLVVLTVAKRILIEDVVEEYSYRQARA